VLSTTPLWPLLSMALFEMSACEPLRTSNPPRDVPYLTFGRH
jgi:hypothetical protein